MEFDAAESNLVNLSFAPGEEGLRRLVKALRLIDGHVQVTPRPHEWDFSLISDRTDCGTVGCAMGLAEVLWPDKRLMCAGNLAARLFPREKWTKSFDFEKIFVPPVVFNRVTPAMVADVIDDYLATGNVRWRTVHPEVFG